MIIRGGNNIHASDVEHVLVQHPDVAEVAVVGAPHPVLGRTWWPSSSCIPVVDVDGDALRAYGSSTWRTTRFPAGFSSSKSSRATPPARWSRTSCASRIGGCNRS